LLALEVAAVGNDGQLFYADSLARLFCHGGELVAIHTVGHDLVCDNQVMLSIYRRLYVVANDATLAIVHRAGVRIG
jgi:hypothetical protein